jgi:hypothetical protein
MTPNLFVHQFAIKPADAVVLNKKFFGMLDHYVIYVGIQNYEHQFVANYVDGVKEIPNDKIGSLLEVYVPSKIERFPGKDHERQAAVNRAKGRIGERAYGFISNNCEHFKNFVHHGIETSTQVEKVGAALTISGIGLALIGVGKKNKTVAVWGLIIVIVGILIAMFAKREKNVEERKNDFLNLNLKTDD